MFGDTKRNRKRRGAGNARCAGTRGRTSAEGLILVKAKAIPRHKQTAEPKARGHKSRNRPANPLTCRASDLLCLDANAVECPWFRNQLKKLGDRPAVDWPAPSARMARQAGSRLKRVGPLFETVPLQR